MSTSLHLFLMRHGEAGSAASDDLRSLTPLGRRHVRAVGRLLASQPEAIDWVISSPLVRAVQTAEAVVGGLGIDEAVEARPEIAFPARVEQLLEVAAEAPPYVRGILLVGHEPTMGLLARHLCGALGPGLGFRTGMVLATRWTRGASEAEALYQIAGQPPTREDLG